MRPDDNTPADPDPQEKLTPEQAARVIEAISEVEREEAESLSDSSNPSDDN